MNLNALQKQFIQQLTHTQLADDFLAQLKSSGKLQPEQQLAIYQNNVRGALQKTMAQLYPVCQTILGESYFKQLLRHYIKDHPSQQSDLNRYGEYFPQFIKEQCQQRAELADFVYLADLAQLEWFRQQVYYAANCDAFDFEAFAQLTESQQAELQFSLIPALKLIRSESPVLSIWQMNQHAENGEQSIAAKQETCCIYRKQNQIEMCLVDNNIYNLLMRISQGATLEKIVQAGLATELPALINQGWLDNFKVKHV